MLCFPFKSGMVPALLFKGFLAFFGFVLLFGNIRSFLRTQKARRTWVRTRGTLEKFIYSYGQADVEYTYSANGNEYQGRNLCVSAFSSIKGDLPLRESFFVNRDGTLKFRTGCKVDVYLDPANPKDAALDVEQASIGRLAIAVGVLLLGGLIFFHFQERWLSLNALRAIGCFFLLCSLVPLAYVLQIFFRYRLTKTATPISASITKGEIRCTQGLRNSRDGYFPYIEFTYEVNGTTFTSSQRRAVSFNEIQSAENAQRELDRLLERREVTAFYLPAKPWDAFLEHGMPKAILFPLFMSLQFVAAGLTFLKKG